MPFGFANFSQLEDGDVDGVYEYVVKPALHKFASFTFRIFAGNLFRRNAEEKRAAFPLCKDGDVGLERLRYETRKQLPDCGQQRRRLTYSVLTEGKGISGG